jgi:hypothetical protein
LIYVGKRTSPNSTTENGNGNVKGKKNLQIANIWSRVKIGVEK